MKILVSNVGSTSLKFKLYDMPSERVLCSARVERVGSSDAIYSWENSLDGTGKRASGLDIPGYTDGIRLFLADMCGPGGPASGMEEIAAVGFKTVLARGFYGVHELTDEVLEAMREYLFVAPAHNGPYLEAIACFKAVMPGARLVGCFETAFHRTIPLSRALYGVPYEWYEKYGIKRMGYHGASHSYVAETLAALFGSSGRTVSCHLGGSCSLCAIENGRSVDTSFGFSLQTGVMHADRTGDLDPYVVPYLLSEGMGMDEILEGPSAFVFAGADPVASAKALKEFAKTNDKLEVKGGRFKQKSMSDYVIPTSMDFPKQFYHIQENPYPWGPYGAKGMGELVFNGASAAYVDAVERALNTRFTSIPIPPEAIEEAMKHVH